MKDEKAPTGTQVDVSTQVLPPAPALKTTAPAAARIAPGPKPSFHIYSRQRDQHVVGPGCWCMPKTEIIDGVKIVVHKRD